MTKKEALKIKQKCRYMLTPTIVSVYGVPFFKKVIEAAKILGELTPEAHIEAKKYL